jgi:AcrR family transcriptional regulator
MSRQNDSTSRIDRDTLHDMPKLWHETIESHRSAVAGAIMDRTAAIAAAEGVHALTMARVAAETGIGRATLYRHFKDVGDILAAWHRRQISTHLADLESIRARYQDPLSALEAVLVAYASHSAHDHHSGLGQVLHAQPHVHDAQRHLQGFIADLIAEASRTGQLDLRSSPDEAARYMLAAMRALPPSPARPAVNRLVAMVLKGVGAG